jgi:hypothetical protein
METYEPTKLNTTYSYTDSLTPAFVNDYPGSDDILLTLARNPRDPNLVVVLVANHSLQPLQSAINYLNHIGTRFCVVISKIDEISDYGSLLKLEHELLTERNKLQLTNVMFPIFFLSSKAPNEMTDHWLKFVEYLKYPPSISSINAMNNAILPSSLLSPSLVSLNSGTSKRSSSNGNRVSNGTSASALTSNMAMVM